MMKLSSALFISGLGKFVAAFVFKKSMNCVADVGQFRRQWGGCGDSEAVVCETAAVDGLGALVCKTAAVDGLGAAVCETAAAVGLAAAGMMCACGLDITVPI